MLRVVSKIKLWDVFEKLTLHVMMTSSTFDSYLYGVTYNIIWVLNYQLNCSNAVLHFISKILNDSLTNVFVIYVVSTNEGGMNEFNASLQNYKRRI